MWVKGQNRQTGRRPAQRTTGSNKGLQSSISEGTLKQWPLYEGATVACRDATGEVAGWCPHWLQCLRWGLVLPFKWNWYFLQNCFSVRHVWLKKSLLFSSLYHRVLITVSPKHTLTVGLSGQLQSGAAGSSCGKVLGRQEAEVSEGQSLDALLVLKHVAPRGTTWICFQAKSLKTRKCSSFVNQESFPRRFFTHN